MQTVSASGGRTANLILVEDDDVDAKAVIRAFKKSRIANPIVRAIDGFDALDLLRGQNGRERPQGPNILLVDINMPRMNGIQLIQKLRQDPRLQSSICFMVTTSKRDEDVAAAYDLNVAGYIVKQNAGEDFLNLIGLLEHYWRVVELPE